MNSGSAADTWPRDIDRASELGQSRLERGERSSNRRGQHLHDVLSHGAIKTKHRRRRDALVEHSLISKHVARHEFWMDEREPHLGGRTTTSRVVRSPGHVRGILSGKYAPGAEPPEGSRAARKDPRILQTEWRAESLDIAQAVAERAAAKGVSTVAFAIAWVIRNRFVSSAICGPRTQEQWDSYLPALDVTLTAEDEAFIDALVPPGHASTPGYTDPIYPIEGRALR